MTKRTAVTFAIITLIIAFIVAAHIKEQQITMFPSDHGNTAGNLHNLGLVFEMDIDSGIPSVLFGDEVHLRQIIKYLSLSIK